MTGRRVETLAHPARYLVLAQSGDTGAAQIAAALERRHGTGHVDLVSAGALARANWVHRQDDSGSTSRVDLEDGRSLTHDGFSLVFNRLRTVFPYRFTVADESDRQYAQSETNALVLSWLSSFACPVVPAPAPPALSPLLPSLPELFVVAGRAGVPTRRFAFTSNARYAPPTDESLAFPGQSPPPAEGLVTEPTPRYQLGRDPALYLEPVAGTPRRLLVAGEDVLGPVPDGLGPAGVRLASESGCTVLALHIDRRGDAGTAGPSRWCLVGANSHPSLDDRDESVAVARYLERRAARGRRPPDRMDTGRDQRTDA